MKTIIGPPGHSGISEKQQAALLTLLTDDDRAVYQTVREKIIASGEESTRWLRPHTLSHDPVLRRRAAEIIRYFALRAADNDFLRFCLTAGEDLDIEQGAFLLSRTKYPGINVAAYQAVLDHYTLEISECLIPEFRPESIVAVINDRLYERFGFFGNETNYYDPDNSYLNRVLDRKTGNPISLCLIYLLTARRLRLPMTGIGMPGHFICRFQGTAQEFYIDAFNKGKILSRADCANYLAQTPDGYRDEFLSPVSSRRLLMRICANLHQIYTKMDSHEEMTRVQSYIVALAK